MSFLKNLGLTVIILILSYFTALYFGNVYGKFSILRDSSMLGLDSRALEFIAGLPFAFIFFTILVFKLLGSGNVNMWIIWLLVLPALFFGSGDLKHIYLPIILGLIALGLTRLIQKIFKLKNINIKTKY